MTDQPLFLWRLIMLKKTLIALAAASVLGFIAKLILSNLED